MRSEIPRTYAAMLAAANQRIAELEAERDQALVHAQFLLKVILEKHFSPNPDFEIGDNLPLVLNQLSNALTSWK